MQHAHHVFKYVRRYSLHGLILGSSKIHRRQAATNRRLIAQAGTNGQQRLAENLRRVQANPDRIIPALEAPEKDGPGDGPR